MGGLRVQRLQQAVQRAGRYQPHVRLIDVVGLYLLQDLAVHGQRLVRFVVVGASKNMTNSRIAKDRYGSCYDADTRRSIHCPPCQKILEHQYNTARSETRKEAKRALRNTAATLFRKDTHKHRKYC